MKKLLENTDIQCQSKHFTWDGRRSLRHYWHKWGAVCGWLGFNSISTQFRLYCTFKMCWNIAPENFKVSKWQIFLDLGNCFKVSDHARSCNDINADVSLHMTPGTTGNRQWSPYFKNMMKMVMESGLQCWHF